MNNRGFYSQLKTREMLAPSMSPIRTPPGLSGYGSSLGALAPRFAEVNGETVTSVPCNIPYIFEVPGYSRVWLHMTRDGAVVHDGEFDVPMPSYTASCTTELGSYVATVYDLTNGALIGTARLTVLAEGAVSNSTLLLAGGAVVLFLLMRRKSS